MLAVLELRSLFTFLRRWNKTMVGVESYGIALPALRLPAKAYIETWGSCGARGMLQKAFCSYDEDAVTLAIEAARNALQQLRSEVKIEGLFFGVTSPPYDEKPSAATLPTALFSTTEMRVTEITGSPQAGVQALLSAIEFCSLKQKGCHALAIAADAPKGPLDAAFEHALGAAAAAFVVGPDGAIAKFNESFCVTRETFGARFRRHGESVLADLELRTRDNLASVQELGRALAKGKVGKIKRLALGADSGLMRSVGRALGQTDAKIDSLWSQIGDAGSASAPFALAAALDVCRAGDTIFCAGVGAGATGALFTAGKKLAIRRRKGPKVTDKIADGSIVDYVTYLKHKRVLSSKFGDAG